jgi:hypothetical protein
MTRAVGVGGIFLRAHDPEKLHAWYEEHLGIKPSSVRAHGK